MTSDLKEKFYELKNHIDLIDSILRNSDKEIRMWRERFLKDAYISHKKEEKEFVKQSIMFTPAGIENINDCIYEQLKCYRETNK